MNENIVVNDSIDSAILNAENIEPVSAENRIEYQLLKSHVDMAGQNVKLVRGNYLPTAGVSVNYNYTLVGISGQGMSNFDNLGLSAMGNIKIPIFHFNEGRGKVAAAKADYSIKQLELQQTRELLQLEIEQARLNYTDAFTRVKMAEQALEQASENMRVSDDNYELGMETLVNLLEAKAEWQKAYSNKIDALTNLKIKESNYLRISNRLLQE
jgi:outer membrane protein TolC